MPRPYGILMLAMLLLAIAHSTSAQTAAPFPPVVYTDAGQSADPSLRNAISTAGEPARSIEAESAGGDTATALVGAFPTTATVGPVTVPEASSTIVFVSGSPGVVLSSNTRPFFTASGTIQTNLPSASLLTQGRNVSGASTLSLEPFRVASAIAIGLGIAVVVAL